MGTGRSKLAAALVPLALALSFSVFFNVAARRVEERFTLPQVLFLACYAGIALERLLWAAALRWLVRAAVATALSLALFEAVQLDVNLLFDPRYDAERFLAERARDGDVIETYGINVYQLRFPSQAGATRVAPTPVARRGPIPGLTELEAPYGDIERRRPRFVVVNECWVWRYVPELFAGPRPEGRIDTTIHERDMENTDATSFFSALFAEELPYRIAYEARFDRAPFRRAKLHGSVSCPIYVFERP